jgi:hypothetical protein
LEILHGVRKYGGQNGENKASEPKKEFGLQYQYDRETYHSIGNFTWSRKKNLLSRVKKAKISLENGT